MTRAEPADSPAVRRAGKRTHRVASYVDVPAAHLKEHSAWPSMERAATAESRPQGVWIRSGKDKPAGAFAAVRYRGYWFWVDDTDLQTKRALTVVVFFFTLAEGAGDQKLPLITIAAQ
jgi:hypothetical protein